MNDLLSLLQQHIPILAAVAANIIFIVFLILNISDDFDKIAGFIKRVLDIRNHWDKLIYARIRENYNKTLIAEEFISWQYKVMQKIYQPLIDEKRQQWGLKINMTKLVIGQKEKLFESITLHLKPVPFPFASICPKEELETRKDVSKDKYPEIKDNNRRLVNKYYRLIKSTIRYPKRMGYMLDELVFDREHWHIKAYVGNYENNLKTSHIMEYELYRMYKKCQNKCDKIDNMTRKEVLDRLPIRRTIHQQFENESDILISGKHRSSLLGVQLFVMVKNYNGSYDVLRIRRSSNVAAKANYLQFIPSGGFEAINDCDDFDSQWDNYSISKVLFRELLEECFGIDEDDNNLSGNNVSPERIYYNVHVKELVKMLEPGAVEPKKAQMELLGTTMSLVGLRHELSFVLKIEDMDFASQLTANYESKSAIHLMDIRNLENIDFWLKEGGREAGGKGGRDDLSLLNCTSAGLFELVRSSKLYQEALKAAKGSMSA